MKEDGHSPPGLGRRWLDAADELGELFAPRFCASCRRYGQSMRGQKALCPLCTRLLALETLRVKTTLLPYSTCPVTTAGEYRQELARCLLAFKNSARTDLTPYLATALTRALNALCQDLTDRGTLHPRQRIYLVPIPSSRASLRRRGYQPAPEITGAARPALQKLQPDYRFTVLDALRPLYPGEKGNGVGGSRRSQKQLGKQERYLAKRNSLTLRQPALHWAGRYLDLTGSICLICDDVATTGASIAEAQRVLTDAGARVLGAAAVARVSLRNSPST